MFHPGCTVDSFGELLRNVAMRTPDQLYQNLSGCAMSIAAFVCFTVYFQRERMSGRGAARERIPSRPGTDRAELDAGLHLTEL